MAQPGLVRANDVLLAVDVQNDFCPGGRLPVPHGDEVVAPLNRLAGRFEHVILTQDWHPPRHSSFASSHPGRRPFETIVTSHGSQTLWPDHCVQGTQGARLHPDLDIPHAALILRKGLRPHIDSYSAFFENDRETPTGLAGYLRERGFGRVFLGGLTFEYCVLYSAQDAKRLGFAVSIIEDACRPFAAGNALRAACRSLAEHEINIIQCAAIL
ncbi:MAG: bifunctional nicotinamidase/pyrazinamidase [Methylocapsa sp.]|nr:bifunctional nicotinamidase/pyrazinamidase [Methylocapsa sp.]